MTSLTPTLAVIDGIPRASSLDIADHFGKQHKDVMRAINNAITQVPEDFARRNFAPSEYRDDNGRMWPMFLLSHDGFSFVVMGFTGKEAASWKVVYIMAFRAMAEELTNRTAPDPALTPDRLSKRGDPERKELTAAINVWVGCAPIHYAGARNIINAHFGVKSVDEMTVAQVREAVALVHQRIAETPKQAALPPARDAKTTARDHWLAAHSDFYSYQNAVSQPRTAFDGETRAFKRHYGYDTTENVSLETIEYLLALRVYLDAAITSATSVARRLTE